MWSGWRLVTGGGVGASAGHGRRHRAICVLLRCDIRKLAETSLECLQPVFGFVLFVRRAAAQFVPRRLAQISGMWIPEDGVHGRVPLQAPESRAHPQQEAAALGAHGGAHSGSWGAWGPWASCSRTCGRGVQEQSRPCLPAYRTQVQDSRYVVSALQPAAGGPETGGWPQTNGSSGSTRGDLGNLGRGRQDWPGGRRTLGHFTPGQYGYGRVYVAPRTGVTATETASRPSQRQRRSPASGHNNSNNHHHNRQQHQQHLHGRAYQQQQQPWAPRPKSPTGLGSPLPAWLGPHQQEGQPPGAAQPHQDPRPYDPLPTSACAGEHVRYQLCDNNSAVSEVRGEHRCELNCRALGFRFYVRLADRVTDGTPCGDNQTALCVSGKALFLQQHVGLVPLQPLAAAPSKLLSSSIRHRTPDWTTITHS
ncbi:hypothetical protein CRUP_025593 [Coryphaenoides rupestris]|nr:hypothetical protein CRUP_025593 [Coryphaenoides rupestris]